MSDLISRKETIRTIDSLGEDYISYYKLLMLIGRLPSVEPERRKGQWVGNFCSCCGLSKYYFLRMVDDECAPFGMWNFCPNCGADMRGE